MPGKIYHKTGANTPGGIAVQGVEQKRVEFFFKKNVPFFNPADVNREYAVRPVAHLSDK